MIKALQKLNLLIEKPYLKYIIPLLWLVFVFYFSFGDFRKSSVNKCNIPHIDKLVHLIMYSGLCYLLLAAKISGQKQYKKFIILACILLGIIIEILQQYVFTYRSGDYLDFTFNLVGIVLSSFIFKRVNTSTN